MNRNYEEKLSASILCRGKCENYRDTGVSKKDIKCCTDPLDNIKAGLIINSAKDNMFTIQPGSLNCRHKEL